jgi:hypothetical protein
LEMRHGPAPGTIRPAVPVRTPPPRPGKRDGSGSGPGPAPGSRPPRTRKRRVPRATGFFFLAGGSRGRARPPLRIPGQAGGIRFEADGLGTLSSPRTSRPAGSRPPARFRRAGPHRPSKRTDAREAAPSSCMSPRVGSAARRPEPRENHRFLLVRPSNEVGTPKRPFKTRWHHELLQGKLKGGCGHARRARLSLTNPALCLCPAQKGTQHNIGLDHSGTTLSRPSPST